MGASARFSAVAILHGLNVRHFSHHVFELDPVTLTDFSTKNNSKATDHIDSHVLKVKIDTD